MTGYSDIEKQDADKVNQALRAIKQNNLSSARSLLNEVISNTPSNYQHSYINGNEEFIKFWSRSEFLQYVRSLSRRDENVVWINNAYPRAYYFLAYLDVHEGKYNSAINHLENSLKLEPDQPSCYCEMAIAYSGLGQHEYALSLYNKALQVRPHITAETKARALRGIGVELIDLQQLDLAEKYLQESLQYEPKSATAHNELEYIYNLRLTAKRVKTMESEIVITTPKSQ